LFEVFKTDGGEPIGRVMVDESIVLNQGFCREEGLESCEVTERVNQIAQILNASTEGATPAHQHNDEGGNQADPEQVLNQGEIAINSEEVVVTQEKMAINSEEVVITQEKMVINSEEKELFIFMIDAFMRETGRPTPTVAFSYDGHCNPQRLPKNAQIIFICQGDGRWRVESEDADLVNRVINSISVILELSKELKKRSKT
jgi:hypothetical protein